jgi:hypothetical protein
MAVRRARLVIGSVGDGSGADRPSCDKGAPMKIEASSGLSRRGVLTGLGALGGVVALGRPAAADPSTPRGNGAHARRGPNTLTSGFPAPIGSAPVAGVSYQFRMFDEFFPEGATLRSYGGNGITGAAGTFSTAVDLPVGAVLYDVEWYYANSGATSVDAVLRVWAAGQGNYAFGGVDVSLPPSVGVVATRALVPSASNGPFPFGTRVVVAVDAMNTHVDINGVRVGYRHGPLAPVLLPRPVLAYDSRHHTPIAGGQTRTISFAAHIPIGANGAIYTLSVLNTHNHGALRVGAAGTSLSVPGIQWGRTGDRLSAAVTSAVSGSRAIGVHAVASKTDFTVDLTGYLI